LEGTFQDHLVRTSCHEQGHLPLGHVAQSPSNLALNTSNDVASKVSLGNLFMSMAAVNFNTGIRACRLRQEEKDRVQKWTL